MRRHSGEVILSPFVTTQPSLATTVAYDVPWQSGRRRHSLRIYTPLRQFVLQSWHSRDRQRLRHTESPECPNTINRATDGTTWASCNTILEPDRGAGAGVHDQGGRSWALQHQGPHCNPHPENHRLGADLLFGLSLRSDYLKKRKHGMLYAFYQHFVFFEIVRTNRF